MSKRRPTEVSWDSDDDLLQDDISGINAFPHSKKEETEEELDEDALLGSDEEGTGKEYEQNDTAEANIPTINDNTTFGVPEIDAGNFTDDLREEELIEDVIEIEPDVDSSLLIDSQDEAAQHEESSEYPAQEGQAGDMSGFDSTIEFQADQSTTQEGNTYEEGGDSSDSDSDGEGGRVRFKSERASIISLSQSKSRTDIPDTLEISEEQQATIDEFLTKDGRKKNQRGGFHRGYRGRGSHQQRRPVAGSNNFGGLPSRAPPPHIGGYKQETPPNQGPGRQNNNQTGHRMNAPSRLPLNFEEGISGGSRPRKILINPHFRGPSPSTATPDTTVTWSQHMPTPRHPPPRPPVINAPSFPATGHQIPYPVSSQPAYNRPPLHGQLFSDPHQRGPGTQLAQDPHRVMNSRPSVDQGMPHKQPFQADPTFPYEQGRSPYPVYSSQGPLNPLPHTAFHPQQRSPQTHTYGQVHAQTPHSSPLGQPRPLLGAPPQALGGLPSGMSVHQRNSAPGLLNRATRPAFLAHQGEQPYFNSASSQPSQPYRRGPFIRGMPSQSGPVGSPPQRQPYRSGGQYLRNQQLQADPAIQFGLLQPAPTFASQPNSLLGCGPAPQMGGGPRTFPTQIQQRQQQHHQQHMDSPFQQGQGQTRGKRFPRGPVPQTQPMQRRGRPGVPPQSQTSSNNNITLVNAGPQKRLSGETTLNESPPKIPRNQGQKNVRDCLQIPSQQKAIDTITRQQVPERKPDPVSQPSKPEEPLDEETRILNEKIEEQKRLRAEVIKRKEARRLQQAEQRRQLLQKKLAEQGMTLSDVDGGSGNSSPQKQATLVQNDQQQKTFVPTKVTAIQPSQGKTVTNKRHGQKSGQVQSQQEPPCKMSRQNSQPHQQARLGISSNHVVLQGRGGFNRQNSRGRGGFVRGQRGVQRGGLTRQALNSGPPPPTATQNPIRDVTLLQSPKPFSTESGQNAFPDQAGRGQNLVRRVQGHRIRGRGNTFKGRGQAGRGSGQVGPDDGSQNVPLRGGGQQRGRVGVQHQASSGQSAGQRTVMARSMSGNNIVLGGGNITGSDPSANRRVIVGPNQAKRSQFVSIDNLSTSTSQEKLGKLCRTIGPVESVQLLQSQNKAIVKFHNPGHSQMFAQKFDRYLLDLSSIRVSTLPS